MFLEQEIAFDDRDEFERRDIAHKIKALLDSDNGSTFFPILVDGDWGAGKTEFLFKLRNYILALPENTKEIKSPEQNYFISYINSFTADYYDDPFMVIVREIYSLLAVKGNTKDLKDLFNIIKGVAPTALGMVVNLTLSVVPGGDAIKEGLNAVSKLSKAAQKAEEVAFESRLKKFLLSTNELQEFHNVLSKTIENIGGKYILIIDELDRCKPDYSLKLLEMIKHLLNIKGLYVIFGANSKYLEASISNAYMKSEESSKSLVLSEEYLAKFYNLRVLLTAKREAWVPEQISITNNYQYFRDGFLGDASLPESFSAPFKFYENLGLAFEKIRDQGIKDPYNRYDAKYHWGILNEEYIASAEAIKVVLISLFGDMELRQREKVKQNVILLHELNAEVLFKVEESDVLRGLYIEWNTPTDQATILQLLEGPLAILIGIGMLRDDPPLVSEIINGDTFFYRPKKVNYDDFPGNLLEMEKIQEYLRGKNIQQEVINNIFTGFVGRDMQSVFYTKGEHSIDSFYDQAYPLGVLINTLKELKGLQIR